MNKKVSIFLFSALFIIMIFLVIFLIMQNVKINKLLNNDENGEVSSKSQITETTNNEKDLNENKNSVNNESSVTKKEDDSIKNLGKEELLNIQNKFNNSNESKNFFTVLSMNTDENGISEYGKVMSTWIYYSIKNPEELSKNELPYGPSTEEMMSTPLLYKVSYIEGIVNNVFDKKLVVDKIENLNITDGNIFISMGGFGLSEYIVNSASYDNKTSKYTINYTRKAYDDSTSYIVTLSYANDNLKIYDIKKI